MINLVKVMEKDLDILTEIKKDSFKKEFALYGFAPQDMVSREWHSYMMEYSIYYKIVKGSTIIGGVNLFKGDKNDAYLCCLFIQSDFQDQGLGTQVIVKIEGLYHKVVKWQLETPSISEANRCFYEKCGYDQIEEYQPEGAPEGFLLCKYEKYILY